MLTKHHIIARSRGGSDHHNNITMLPLKEHRNLHDFHGVDLPNEQISRILQIAEPCLNERAYRDILTCLDDWGLDMYKSHCWKRRNGILVPS